MAKNKRRLIDANALTEEAAKAKIRMPHDKAAVFDLIEKAPTVDAVEVVHGRWDKNWSGDNIVYCDQCYMPQDAPTPYCSSCGAKMDGERKDNGKE